MQNVQRADAIDTRIVFWTYAALAGLTGVALFVWGPSWLGTGSAGLVRLFSSVVVASGCFAAALAGVEDPSARRRGVLWFMAAQIVVTNVLLSQGSAISLHGFMQLAAQVINAIIGFVFFLLLTSANECGLLRLTGLFGNALPLPAGRLRSQYEQQIREAARQEERNRLARDLHDSIKQQIFVVQTAAATTQVRFEEDPAGAKLALEQVRSSAREALTEMEAMLDQLRAAPLGNAGLVEAVKKQCEALGFRTGARVEFKLGTLPPSEALAPGAQQAMLRVAQEALANIGRHARARNVTVTLDSVRDRFELWVRDDGSGFDQNQAPVGMGIANMHARAEEFDGTFELGSHPGGGTWVHFEVPCSIQVPGEFRHRALTYGGALVVSIVCIIIQPKIAGLPFAGAVLSAIGLARETAACRRARRQNEATT